MNKKKLSLFAVITLVACLAISCDTGDSQGKNLTGTRWERDDGSNKIFIEFISDTQCLMGITKNSEDIIGEAYTYSVTSSAIIFDTDDTISMFAKYDAKTIRTSDGKAFKKVPCTFKNVAGTRWEAKDGNDTLFLDFPTDSKLFMGDSIKGNDIVDQQQTYFVSSKSIYLPNVEDDDNNTMSYDGNKIIFNSTTYTKVPRTIKSVTGTRWEGVNGDDTIFIEFTSDTECISGAVDDDIDEIQNTTNYYLGSKSIFTEDGDAFNSVTDKSMICYDVPFTMQPCSFSDFNGTRWEVEDEDAGMVFFLEFISDSKIFEGAVVNRQDKIYSCSSYVTGSKAVSFLVNDNIYSASYTKNDITINNYNLKKVALSEVKVDLAGTRWEAINESGKKQFITFIDEKDCTSGTVDSDGNEHARIVEYACGSKSLYIDGKTFQFYGSTMKDENGLDFQKVSSNKIQNLSGTRWESKEDDGTIQFEEFTPDSKCYFGTVYNGVEKFNKVYAYTLADDTVYFEGMDSVQKIDFANNTATLNDIIFTKVN